MTDAVDEKMVFIDRDGVINVDLIGDYVKSPAEFRFEDGAVEALKTLSKSGYRIVVISNQAGIGDGIFSEDALKETHAHMLKELKGQGVEIADTYYCLHGKEEGCGCRKPETGLFEQAARKYPFDRSRTYFIGDKATDVEAGKRFGLKTIFVLTGHGSKDASKLTPELQPDYQCADLTEAARYLVTREN